MTAVGATTFLPCLPTRAAAQTPMPRKPMTGAFMILSTPYTNADEIDYDDLAGQVDFVDRCGVDGIV